MTEIMFGALVSLLLVHEMDAVRTKEWKMFFVLKNMTDETAYKVFTLAHFPLFFAVVYCMIQGSAHTILFCILDSFLLGHTIIHFCFRKKPNNGFNSTFSKVIIYGMGVLAVVHILLLLFMR